MKGASLFCSSVEEIRRRLGQQIGFAVADVFDRQGFGVVPLGQSDGESDSAAGDAEDLPVERAVVVGGPRNGRGDLGDVDPTRPRITLSGAPGAMPPVCSIRSRPLAAQSVATAGSPAPLLPAGRSLMTTAAPRAASSSTCERRVRFPHR